MLQAVSLWLLTQQLFHDYTIQYQNLQFPFCSKQFSFLADCFIAHTLCPINKHLLSHDSDKWKPPLHPYEIVYPQKLLTWKYEKLGCPGIYHIPLVQCHFEMVKWLRHLLHFSLNAPRPILHLKACLWCHCLPKEAAHSPNCSPALTELIHTYST